MADFPDSTALPEITRPMIESEIERLIAILDSIDPEPDLEDNGDGEPWLGAPEARTGSWSGFMPEGNDDREADDADDEPELGSRELMNQSSWATGGDGEPSLGSSGNHNQEYWGLWSGDDREEECEDEGAQCEDEGCVDEDCGASEDDPPGCDLWGYRLWGAERSREYDEQTTAACCEAIGSLRAVMKRNGRTPINPPRMIGGAIVK